MKLQHDTHYLTSTLDVRYVVADKISQNFWSKHSLYNPRNIDNTEGISEYGSTYSCNKNKDIDPYSGLCIQRDYEKFILLQNFEFVNYYGDQLISTAKDISDDFTFLSDKNTKQGCIRVRERGTIHTEEFPILALTTNVSCTIKNKLDNLMRRIQ